MSATKRKKPSVLIFYEPKNHAERVAIEGQLSGCCTSVLLDNPEEVTTCVQSTPGAFDFAITVVGKKGVLRKDLNSIEICLNQQEKRMVTKICEARVRLYTLPRPLLYMNPTYLDVFCRKTHRTPPVSPTRPMEWAVGPVSGIGHLYLGFSWERIVRCARTNLGI